MNGRIYIGDSFDVLGTLPENSFDSCVADPPYGIRFMGKAWDGADIVAKTADRMQYSTDNDPRSGESGGHRSVAAEAGKYDRSTTANIAFMEWTRAWATEVFRVLKPGAHIVSFASTRTYHRMVCGIEDAGFEIRDQLAWVFGSGFPKSSNQEGEWDGYGTALKPSWEPIVLARKPLVGTVPANLAAHGTGALNIDGCRIGSELRTFQSSGAPGGNGQRLSGGDGRDIETAKIYSDKSRSRGLQEVEGRWPANIIHDGSDEVVAMFPSAPGQQGDLNGQSKGRKSKGIYGDLPAACEALAREDESESAARFFYCAKASQEDRDAGLEYFQRAKVNDGRDTPIDNAYQRGETLRKNTHPTVKPTDLMRWLCRLVTPKGGHILDPFLGSGSTGRGAVLEGFTFTGIEREDEYVPLAHARIMEAAGELFGKVELIDTRKPA